MLINIGVDYGYSYIKVKSKLKEVRFDSYIKEISEIEAVDIAKNIESLNENNLLVKFNNKYYVLGRLAIKLYPSLNKRISKIRKDDLTIVAYLTAIALNFDNKELLVNLAIGLPNRSSNDKEATENMLRNDFKISLISKHGEIQKHIIIKETFAMLQSVACTFVLTEEDRTENKVLVVDCGYGTTDFCFSDAGIISREVGMRYSTRGVERLYKALKEGVVQSLGVKGYNIIDINEKEVQAIIESNKMFYNSKEIDIKEIYEKCLRDFAIEIFNDIESNFGTLLQSTDLMLGSGGIFNNVYFSSYFVKLLKETYNITFILEKDYPTWTVCHGLFNFSNLYWDDDFQTLNSASEKENEKESECDVCEK